MKVLSIGQLPSPYPRRSDRWCLLNYFLRLLSVCAIVLNALRQEKLAMNIARIKANIVGVSHSAVGSAGSNRRAVTFVAWLLLGLVSWDLDELGDCCFSVHAVRAENGCVISPPGDGPHPGRRVYTGTHCSTLPRARRVQAAVVVGALARTVDGRSCDCSCGG